MISKYKLFSSNLSMDLAWFYPYVGEVKFLGKGVQIFASGRGVVKNGPGRGIKITV